jgi:hypothetical protein
MPVLRCVDQTFDVAVNNADSALSGLCKSLAQMDICLAISPLLECLQWIVCVDPEATVMKSVAQSKPTRILRVVFGHLFV